MNNSIAKNHNNFYSFGNETSLNTKNILSCLANQKQNDEFGFSVFPALNGTKLCGVPGVCSQTAETKCSNVSLYNCSECSAVASGMFIFVVALLGLSIIFGNGLIINVYIDLKRKRKTTKVDLVKVSLAVADMIAGMLIFFVAFPNFAWTMNSTLEKLFEAVKFSKNSASSIVGGFFYLLGYTASLYHLMLLGMMRLYSIKRPHQYIQMSDHKAIIALVIAWILSCAVATIPAWFLEYFSYQYNAVTFFYLMTLNDDTSYGQICIPGIIAVVLLIAIPFLIMTALSISTAILVRQKLQASNEQFPQCSSKHGLFKKKEASAFKSMAFMQFGFTITLIPLGIVAALLYVRVLTCNTFSTSLITCFYLSLSNSLVNVIVYSIREKKFRETTRLIYDNLRHTLRRYCNRQNYAISSSATTSNTAKNATTNL